MKRREPLAVPRASLSVTLLSDPEFIEACQTPEGRQAVLLFTCLIMAAKEQNNEGRFAQAPAVLAMMVRWPMADFKIALEYLLKMPGKWVVRDSGAVVVRSFSRWNAGWGGAREGAGRPPHDENKKIQEPIQDAIQGNSRPPVPASVSVVKDIGAKKPRPDQLFAKSLLPLLASKAPDTEGELCKAFNTLKKSFSVANIETARDIAKRKAVSFADAGNVIGWFTNTIRNLGNGQTRPEPEYDMPAGAIHA